MNAALLEDIAPRLHRITVDDFRQMCANGIVPEDVSLELIEGAIVRVDRSEVGADPMSISNKHVYAVEQLRDLNERAKPLGFHVRGRQPIRLTPYNEPIPDAIFVHGLLGAYRDRELEVADVTCVAEVSSSSLRTDRKTKLPLYARAGVPQYVIVNLVEGVIEVYGNPNSGAGEYAPPLVRRRGEAVAFNLGDGRTLDVACDDLLP
jgi:Uma2 family endonuclease